MTDSIEKKCIANGVKLTDQRKTIARVISESKKTYGEADHPDVDELYKRVSNIDPKIRIATVYRTVKLFEESGILMKTFLTFSKEYCFFVKNFINKIENLSKFFLQFSCSLV